MCRRATSHEGTSPAVKRASKRTFADASREPNALRSGVVDTHLRVGHETHRVQFKQEGIRAKSGPADCPIAANTRRQYDKLHSAQTE